MFKQFLVTAAAVTTGIVLFSGLSFGVQRVTQYNDCMDLPAKVKKVYGATIVTDFSFVSAECNIELKP